MAVDFNALVASLACFDDVMPPDAAICVSAVEIIVFPDVVADIFDAALDDAIFMVETEAAIVSRAMVTAIESFAADWNASTVFANAVLRIRLNDVALPLRNAMMPPHHEPA